MRIFKVEENNVSGLRISRSRSRVRARTATQSAIPQGDSHLPRRPLEDYAFVCFENVWMPHSSFVPPQRPDLGLFGSTGSAVQGWHPMLRYPSSY